jgi:tRNA-2-methylthio-N6-dimethylallyladenosine synthase
LQLNHFAELLWEVNQIEGIQRIHWTAPHPNSMTDEVIDALTLPKQVNYLHLPVQAGSTEVLFRMNRKYSREQFLDVVQRIKQKRPDIALGTDIIVGFPGETPEQFEETVSLYRACDFDLS